MHTPGPWNWAETEEGAKCSVYHNGPIAYVGENTNGAENMRANARLIAEAPTLLAIAESAVSLWGFMVNDPAIDSASRKTAARNRDHVREVLARIRGE